MKKASILLLAMLFAFASCAPEETLSPEAPATKSTAGARTVADHELLFEDLGPIIIPDGFRNKLTSGSADVVYNMNSKKLYFYPTGSPILLGRTIGLEDNPNAVWDAFVWDNVAYAYGRHPSIGKVFYTPRFNEGSVKRVYMLQTVSGEEIVGGIATIGNLRARQDGNRVYIEEFNGSSWKNIGRTNGNTDDGTLKEFVVVDGVPFAIIQRRAEQFILVTPAYNGGSVKLVTIIDANFNYQD
jgi:hypothetical protein